MRRSPERKVDERDVMLIRSLEEDGRKPWRQVASELGVSEATVYLRVKRLSDDGVLRGFTVRVDPAKLGLEATAFMLVKVRADSVAKVREDLKRLPYVVEAHEVTGPHNFLLKVLAPSQRDVSRAVEEIASLQGVVEVISMLSLSEVKSISGLSEVYDYWTSRRG
ncbi:MAG: Lrp/AsnC family transcriptional regulator [Acidilobus sp.]